MRVRNCTGIPQALQGGVILPPNEWLEVPAQVGYEDALLAWKFRVAEIDTSADDKEALWREADGTHVFWMSPFSQGDGYATAAENMVLALDRRGLRLHVRECWFADLQGLNPRTVELLLTCRPTVTKVGICMATPGEFRKLPSAYRVGITMYEADDPLAPHAHPEWRHNCEQVDVLAVPSEYCAEVFGKFFKGQIEVIPLAVNPKYYLNRRREPKDTFTFVTWGTLNGRKAPLETVDVFKKAFPADKYPDVRMEFKTRLGVFGWGENMLPIINDPRIVVHNATWGIDQVIAWLLRSDCCLFLSKGEGFGMPPREALCTGMPVIFSNHTGLKSLVNEDYNWPVPIGEIEKNSPLGGAWRLPDWDYAIDCMRWVYEHREEAYQKAEDGATWYIQTFGDNAVAAELQGLIESVDPASSKRPGRGPAERLTALTLGHHADFYDAVEEHVRPPGPILVVGAGEGLAYAGLARRGYSIYCAVFPGEKEHLEKRLRGFGIEPRIFEFNLFRLQKAHLRELGFRLPLAVVSQCYLQRFDWREVKRLVAAQLACGCPVFLSVPSLHYPKLYDDRSNMWRLDRWRDILLGFEARSCYYGKDKRYILAQVLGPAKPAPVGEPVYPVGIMVDGVWRPRRTGEQVKEV